ncbi:MAG TPA: hypothetical protein VFW11_20330 [Cyclobacteriaceae bacterium]|nr:hypothetical protein [Cyclobacteriaceae bacterium]
MELRDLIVTPVIILLVYTIAYLIRPLVTDEVNRKYFFPALTVRIIGALAVGFVYQFYYGGGDTFAYHTHGSRVIWEAFIDSPAKGLDLLFSNGQHHAETYSYSNRIWYFRDQQSFFIIRVAAFLDAFTFSTYSGTAVLFAVIAFTGSWLLFLCFYKLYPDFHRWLSIACMFIPTVFFWGSGIFKDTLTLAALEVATFLAFKISEDRKGSLLYVGIFVLCCWVIYSIKIYILLTFLPAIILWTFTRYLVNVQSQMLKILMLPFTIILSVVSGYYAIQKVAEDDPRYNLQRIAETAKITAYDIRYGWGARAGEGSGYTLGELDGSFESLVRLAPQAINVSLFRPYLWEVRNPFMLLSAVEGLILLGITFYVLIKARTDFFRRMSQPEILFCMIFSLVFAFSVGVSTYNFGTLSRYKIPLMPYYLVGIGLIYYYSKRERKLSELEETE